MFQSVILCTVSEVTHRVEDAHRAGMAENGTLSYPQSVDSRQSGRPHDQGHDARETDQVCTCSELVTINFDSRGPTCTLETETQITTALTVLTNTFNNSQNHSLARSWEQRLRQDRRCERRIHHSFLLKTLMNPPNACWTRMDVASMMAGMVCSCTTARRKVSALNTALNTVTNLKAPLEGLWLGRNKYRITRTNERSTVTTH